MTAQRPPPTPPLSQLSAASALALVDANRAVLVDARSPSSHALEHVTGALSRPPSHRLAAKSVLVYDAGAPALNHASSLAVQLMKSYAQASQPPNALYLVQGGLPALRSVAPHRVIVGSGMIQARRKLRGMRWAQKTLQRVEWEAESMGNVLPWLWVGADRHAADETLLKRNHITHLLVAGAELKPRFQHSFSYKHVHAEDVPSYPINNHFAQVVTYLETIRRSIKNGSRASVLVHCYAGASRSVALILAYLVWRGWPLQDALEKVRNVRRAAEPNKGFMRQLKQWEQQVMDGIWTSLQSEWLFVADSLEDDDEQPLIVEECLEHQPSVQQMPPSMAKISVIDSFASPTTPCLRKVSFVKERQNTPELDDKVRDISKRERVSTPTSRFLSAEGLLLPSPPMLLPNPATSGDWTSDVSDSGAIDEHAD